MALSPAIIASWPEPNYVNPVTLSTPVHAVNGVCIATMTVIIAARFYARTRVVRKPLGADDWTMFVAYLLCLTLEIVHIVELKFGIGRHLYDVQSNMTEQIGKMSLITQSIFAPAVALTKVSICIGYLHLFPTPNSIRFSYILIGILIAYGASSFVVVVVQCIPIQDSWNILKPDQEKQCISTVAFFTWQVATNAALDILVFLWPVRYLWVVKTPRSTRIALIACFGCGVMICVIALVRIWLITHLLGLWDRTWNIAVFYILVSVELSLGIICGSLPGIRPLVLRMWPTYTESNASSGVLKGSSGKASSHNQGDDSRKSALKAHSAELGLSTNDYELGTLDERPENTSLDIDRRMESSGMRQGSEDRIISSRSTAVNE